METWIIFMFGVLIGWITKTPWLNKKYRKWEQENERIRQLIKNLRTRE